MRLSVGAWYGLWWVWLERCRDGSYAVNVWVVCACITVCTVANHPLCTHLHICFHLSKKCPKTSYRKSTLPKSAKTRHVGMHFHQKTLSQKPMKQASLHVLFLHFLAKCFFCNLFWGIFLRGESKCVGVCIVDGVGMESV